MVVTVDAYDVNLKVRELLIKSYGFEEETAESIALNIERILEETEG